MEMPGKLLYLLAFVWIWGPGPWSFGLLLSLLQHEELYTFMLCVCVWHFPALLSLTMSTASNSGKLIKLKCLAGNHTKVKEMLCKLLLAPTSLRRVETLISSCVLFELRSGWTVAERGKLNCHCWFFCFHIRGKWTFNKSTIWGCGPCALYDKHRKQRERKGPLSVGLHQQCLICVSALITTVCTCLGNKGTNFDSGMFHVFTSCRISAGQGLLGHITFTLAADFHT